MAHQMVSIHSLLFWWLTFDWFNHLIARCDMGKGLLLEGRKHPIQLTFAIFKKAMVSLSIIQFCNNVDLRKQSLFFFPGFEGQICSELLRPDADVPRPPSLYHFSPLCPRLPGEPVKSHGFHLWYFPLNIDSTPNKHKKI